MVFLNREGGDWKLESINCHFLKTWAQKLAQCHSHLVVLMNGSRAPAWREQTFCPLLKIQSVSWSFEFPLSRFLCLDLYPILIGLFVFDL